MSEEKFKKFVELITSMSLDYVLKGKLTQETYISNLETCVKLLKENQ